jgi:hypothetical protein
MNGLQRSWYRLGRLSPQYLQFCHSKTKLDEMSRPCRTSLSKDFSSFCALDTIWMKTAASTFSAKQNGQSWPLSPPISLTSSPPPPAWRRALLWSHLPLLTLSVSALLFILPWDAWARINLSVFMESVPGETGTWTKDSLLFDFFFLKKKKCSSNCVQGNWIDKDKHNRTPAFQ